MADFADLVAVVDERIIAAGTTGLTVVVVIGAVGRRRGRARSDARTADSRRGSVGRGRRRG